MSSRSESLPEPTTPDALQEERKALREVRERFGKRLGRDCDEWACASTVEDGPLWRVNLKGRPGIFMCSAHRDGYAPDPRESGDV